MAFDAGAIIGRMTLQGTREFETSMQRVRQVTRETVQESRQVPPALREIETSSHGTRQRILEMAGAFGIATTALQAMARMKGIVIETFNRGIDVLEQLDSATIRLASSLATFQPDLPFARAVERARALVDAARVLDAQFVGTGQELVGVLEQATKMGLGFNLETQRGRQSFVALATVIKTMNPQLEAGVAAFSEFRALVDGTVTRGAELAKLLTAQGINLQEQVAIWRQTGEIPPQIVEALRGVEASLGLQQNQLSTLRSTWRTIVDDVLARGMKAGLEDVKTLQRELNDSIRDGRGEYTEAGRLLTGLVAVAWQDTIAAAKATLAILEAFAPALKLAGLAILGLGAGLGAALISAEALVKHFAAIARLDFRGAVRAFDEGAERMDKFLVDVGMAMEGLSNVSAGAQTGAADMSRLRQAFLESAEGLQMLAAAGRISTDELIAGLRKLRDATDESTREGLETSLKLTATIKRLEEQRAQAATASQDRILAGVRQMQEAIARLQGDAFELELERVRRHRDELLKLAGQDTERQLQIRRTANELIEALQAEHHRKLRDELRNAQVSADAALLEAAGRSFQARLVEMRRRHEVERQAVQQHEEMLLAIRRRQWAEFVQTVRQAYDSITHRAEDARRQIQGIDLQLINVRKEFFGETAEEQRRRLEELKQAHTLDPQTLLQVNRELLQLSRASAQERAQALMEEAAQLRARAEQFRQAFDPLRADLALRGAMQRESAARSLLAEVEALGKTLGEEIESALLQQREALVDKLEELRVELTQIKEHTARMAQDLGRPAGIEGVVGAGLGASTPPIPTAPTVPVPAPPRVLQGIGAILREEGGGVGVVRIANATINVDLPSWVKSTEDAIRFIQGVIAETAESTARRSPGEQP